MATTPTPPPQQGKMPVAEAVNPEAYANYIRQVAAQQANTTGLTQVAPSAAGATPPSQYQPQQVGKQSARVFGPGEGAARHREAMNNLVNTVKGVANQIGQAVQQKRNREYQQTVGNYVNYVKGIQDAQGQIQQSMGQIRQAQAKLAANPNDTQARVDMSQAQALFNQAHQALNVNRTNLNDLVGEKKNHKIITKAFGIDDKNSNTPERMAAINALRQQMGVGQQAASVLSHMPQTQQLSPQAQAQAEARQAGVIGKPPTSGQVLNAIGHAADQSLKRGMTIDKLQPALASKGLMIETGPDGQPKHNADGSVVIRPMTQEEIAKNPVASAALKAKQAQAKAAAATAESKTDPNNPELKAKMLAAHARMLSAQASMVRAHKTAISGGRGGLGTDPGNLVDEIGTGKIAPERMAYLLTRNPQLMQEVAKKYPDFDSSKAAAYPRVYQEFTSGKVGQQLTAGGTALEHMQELKKLNTRKSVIPFTPEWTAYRAKANQVAVELAGFYGTNTEVAIANYLKTLDSMIPENRDAAIRTQAQSMGDRIHNLSQQWRNAAPSPAYEAKMPGLSDEAISAWKSLDPGYRPLNTGEKKPSGGAPTPTPKAGKKSASDPLGLF